MTGPSDGPVPLTDHGFYRRFGRQIIVPQIGVAGQRRLASSRVLVVGLGGLGSAAATALAAAGIGELHLLDFDVVDESNLHRQYLYTAADVGRPKAEAAAQRLAERDGRTQVRAEVARFGADDALPRVESVDLVVDASDNFPTRYLVSDACARVGRPDIFAAVHRLEGQFAAFDARTGPCYRCLFPEPPPPEAAPACGEAGVLGVVPPLLGTLQAAEAVRRLMGWGAPAPTSLKLWDFETMELREFEVERRDGCAGCSPAARTRPWAVAAAPQPRTTDPPADDFTFLEPTELDRELRSPRPPTLVDVRAAEERQVARLPGARWIPLDELPERVAELSDAERPVVFCQWGGRSERAGRLLSEAGLRPVRVLRGGLDAYAAEVDPAMPRI